MVTERGSMKPSWMNSALLPSERSDMGILRSQLQIDLDNVTDYYNYRRMHWGYKLEQNGFRKPAEAHSAKNLTSNRKSVRVRKLESIRGKRRWKKLCLLPMILLKQRTRKGAPEHQLVTRS